MERQAIPPQPELEIIIDQLFEESDLEVIRILSKYIRSENGAR